MADAKPVKHTLRTFALICVAITSAYVMWMGVWHTNLLATKDWCIRALGAGDAADQGSREFIKGAEACVGLLGQQVEALALNSHMYAGVIALCLLALMVIVIAGGKISFKGPGGFGGSVGKNDDADELVLDEKMKAPAAPTEYVEPPAFEGKP